MSLELLENGMTPEPGKRYMLVETMALDDLEVVSDPFELVESEGQLLERRKADGPMTIKGIFQYEGKRNQNKRVYPKGLWEKICGNSKHPLMERIKSRQCIGQLEHPKSGVSDLKESTILVTDVRMGEPDAEGNRPVIGEAEILDTPNGALVRGLVRNNVRIGISSRGSGTINSRGEVDESTYKPDTWDIVANPSTPGAFPSLDGNVTNESIIDGDSSKFALRSNADGSAWSVVESNSRKVVRRFDLSEPTLDGAYAMKGSYKTIQRLVESYVGLPFESFPQKRLAEMRETLDEASINLGEFSQLDESTSMKPSIDRLQSQITDVIGAIDEAARKKRCESDDEKDGTGSGKSYDAEAGDDEADGKDEGSHKKRKRKNEARSKGKDPNDYADDDSEEMSESETIELLTSKLVEARNYLQEAADLEESLVEATESLEEMASINDNALSAIESLVAENAANREMIRVLTASASGSQSVSESISERIEDLLESNSELESFRNIFEAATSEEQLEEMIKRFWPGSLSEDTEDVSVGFVPSTGRSDLPPNGKSFDSKEDQTLDESSSEEEQSWRKASVGGNGVSALLEGIGESSARRL